MIDLSNLPVSGGFVLAVVLYAGGSIAAGQLIGGRMIERSDWQETCEAGVKAEVASRKKPPLAMPRTDCQSMFGGLHMELSRLCWHFGNPDLAGPGGAAARAAERRARAAANRKLDAAAAAAGERCSCAATVYRQENWGPLGVYAGSARGISLSSIDHMQAELSMALSAPACVTLGEGRP